MLEAELDSLKQRQTDLDEKKQSAADSRTGSVIALAPLSAK
jgi:hypothetical protein